mmetsp:Transcript_35460/g.77621  ORF Transcript_35460/g.77621 Transcript_35460/m.77621 type:complete len:203 (-) Transcript_35460:2-610(-)
MAQQAAETVASATAMPLPALRRSRIDFTEMSSKASRSPFWPDLSCVAEAAGATSPASPATGVGPTEGAVSAGGPGAAAGWGTGPVPATRSTGDGASGSWLSMSSRRRRRRLHSSSRSSASNPALRSRGASAPHARRRAALNSRARRSRASSPPSQASRPNRSTRRLARSRSTASSRACALAWFPRGTIPTRPRAEGPRAKLA